MVQTMMNDTVTLLPDNYKRGVRKDLRGTVSEISYPVMNYINRSREFVTDQNIDYEKIGRKAVKGECIHKKCNIYLPACYDRNDASKRYNVLYLLHGVGGDRFEWLNGSGRVDDNYVICNIVDNLIANGDIEPLIIVFPDGRSAWDWTDTSFNSDGTNMLGFYYFDYELRYDLIPFIETHYHTNSNPSDRSQEGLADSRLHRAIAGLSMGGMQSLNLIIGGYRCDSIAYTNTVSPWNNGLDTTLIAPGMLDMFAYIGAFSNAPTSSDGKVLGSKIAASSHTLQLLYMTCGDADGIAHQAGYEASVEGLTKAVGERLGDSYRVIIKDGEHDFNVWNNGAYNYLRLCYKEAKKQGNVAHVTLG
ncbi:MAG TPA: alpha/beta hydrolase-fold protein [Lachnospiraceae bacterium]|nr:alpha/beta hydrolase-fold protein [Lachnospiraceae bacterium]